MITTLKRILKLGWQNFSRDGGIVIATIFILVLAILLVSTIFLLKDVSQFLITSLEEKADISVYFKESANEEDILKVKDLLSQIPEVKKIEYISQKEALKKLMERHPELEESIKETEPLLKIASLNVKVFENSQYQKVINFLENSNFKDIIEEIDYQQRKPIIERIFSLSKFFKQTLIILSIVLIICAVLVTFNTIRLAILNSIEEIKIQRLVGASNFFIRGPFIVQGAISGTVAALISLFVFGFICWIISSKIEFFLGGLNLFNIFLKNFKILFLIQIATGILLATISSTIAIRKYLKI
jgi:cell division transport system permease protein